MPGQVCRASLSEITASLFETVSDRINVALAAAAISLPVWHPSLHDVSDTFALIAPILGCFWLCVQIVAKIGEIRDRKHRDDDGE